MMFVEFQNEDRPAMWRLFVAGPVPEDGSSSWSEIASSPVRPFSRPGSGRRSGQNRGVRNVHTLGFGSGRTGAGLGRIAEVFGGVAETQGLESGSSPTSGTVFPLFRGLLVFFRVHIVHILASDLMFRVCGDSDVLCGCVGERLTAAGRIPPCGVIARRSSLFVLPLGFRVHQFMVAGTAYNMTC
jgi:hypothetical protein